MKHSFTADRALKLQDWSIVPDSNRRLLVGSQRPLADWTNDANLVAMEDDEDRTEWDQAWSLMLNRRILDVSKGQFERMFRGEFGDVVTVTICKAPKEFADKLFIENALCPICGQSTESDSSRVVTSVTPRFVKLIHGVGFGAWTHSNCLDMCPLIDEPTPIPW